MGKIVKHGKGYINIPVPNKKKPLFKRKRIKKKANLKKCVELSNHKCQYCGSANVVSAHHIIFRSDDGDDALENLISLCFTCHRRVHDGFYENNHYVTAREFMIRILKYLNEKRYIEVLKILEERE
ncbi:MAG: HNH endonuclease [Vampirovibrionia bacterium]